MKPFKHKSLCILFSLFLALVPASLFAKADNCCPDASLSCHTMNMAMPCSQCIPTAMSSPALVLIADHTGIKPESIQAQYQYPPNHTIWRPPTSQRES